MSCLFNRASSFNQRLNHWNTSKVTNMIQVFFAATSFNQPLDGWDTSGVTTMGSMFQNAKAFDQNINAWNTSNVTNMSNVFFGAVAFNHPLRGWDTDSVTTMRSSKFALRIHSFYIDHSFLTFFCTFWLFLFFIFISNNNKQHTLHCCGIVFYRATSFNKCLETWNVRGVNTTLMFKGAKSMTQLNLPLSRRCRSTTC